jgi:hypothetical protein
VTSNYAALVSAVNHPDSVHPYRALFNHRSLKSLSRTGVRLDVVSPRPFAPPVGPYSRYGSIPDIEEWETYTVHHPRFWYLLPKRLLYGLSGESFSKRVPRYVEQTFEVPDVVHACHIYLDGYGMLPYVRKHDLPLFVVAHGKLLNSLDDHPYGVREKVVETLDEATGVLCVSDALAAKAREVTAPEKVVTVPLGADPEQFPVAQRDQLRAEFGVPADATVVLFVGQFTSRKGISELVELLPNLDLPDTVFVFVGHGGDMRDDLERAVAESSYSSEFVYSNVTSERLQAWFAVADLLLLPSHAEGRPTVIYEAMASKTAILASAVGGIPEQVVDGETGRLVPPGDVPALRDALQSLTTDGSALAEMGSRGYQRLIDEEWTWAGHADRIRELHRAVIE